MKLLDKAAVLYARFRLLLLAIVLIAVSLIGLQKFIYATQLHGIGMTTDSVAYVWSAENLSKGMGLGRLDGYANFRPYTGWPPLYPIFLAGLDWLGYGGLEGARLFSAICIVLLSVVTGLALARGTNNSPWYAAGGLLILINSPIQWNSDLYAMSEPLYVLLSLSALLLLDAYIARGKRVVLIIASALIGLALATRYVGVSLILAGWLYLLIQKSFTWRRKIIDALILGVVAVIPIVLWTARNMLVAHTAANRSLSFATISSDEWSAAGQAMLNWFNPVLKMTPMGVIKPLLVIMAAFITASLFFKLISRHASAPKGNFPVLMAFYAVSYIISVIVSKLFVDPNVLMAEDRILFPLFMAVLILIIALLYRLQVRIQPVGWPASAAVVCLLVFGTWSYTRAYSNLSINILAISRNAGMGLARDKQAYEPLLDVLEQYQLQDNIFFTDNIERLYFLSSIYSFQVTSAQQDEIERVLSESFEHGVVLVLFDQLDYGPQFQANIPGLDLVYQGMADVYIIP